LSSTLGISIQTVKNYISYAEKTFIIQRLTPYFRNLRKEISKAPVMYFYDIGMRNFAVRQFGRYTMFSEMGFVFQNLVYNLLCEKTRDNGSTIHFWRTKDRAEVDFIINKGDDVIPVEVKCTHLKDKRLSRSLRGFIARYSPKEAWVVNLSFKEQYQIGNTQIRFTPYHEIL
ncbi:MAG TPA: DUF4143 domain-containing protein, partial [Syntrophales bacterium]|nr:DUF4143 domain-containing protein [Syntrophales bacterium]